MVNINIEIPPEIHKSVKLAAIQADKTTKEYIIERLDDGLKGKGR